MTRPIGRRMRRPYARLLMFNCRINTDDYADSLSELQGIFSSVLKRLKATLVALACSREIHPPDDFENPGRA
jgi:hypothetical protein